MNNKTCFFLGNKHTPTSIKQQLIKTIKQHITEYNVTIFTDGHYGSFDRLVTEALRDIKKTISKLSTNKS